MRLRNKDYTLLLLLSFLWMSMSAQDYRSKGDQAWEQGEIKTAVNAYGFIKDLEKDGKYLMKRGIGNFKLNYLKKAIRDFTQARKVGIKDPELFNYMAQVKQQLLEFEEACFFYKEYIKAVGENDPRAYRALIELKNSLYAANHLNEPTVAMMNDFGEDVNSYYDELYPIQSPRFGNIFYYTSNSNKEDMRGYSIAMDKNGEWLPKKKFGVGVNTKYDDYIMDISPDGQSMLFVRSEKGQSKNKIYVSTFDENEEQHVIELPDYLIFGAKDLQIVNRNIIAFASKDLGGAGGYDLFTINYKHRVWSDPINMGPEVNSEFDERSPFLSADGQYLYFSSDRPYCYGGYDVYYFNFLWVEQEPRNVGQPINGPGDDLQYRLSEDGQLAIMSSNRKTGKGGFDIYMMYLKEAKPFPARDTTQLEYVADYLKQPKTHLDKLKEKLASEEVAASETDLEEEKQELETKEIEKAVEKKTEEVIVETDISKPLEQTTDVPTEVVKAETPETKLDEPVTTGTKKPVAEVVASSEEKKEVTQMAAEGEDNRDKVSTETMSKTSTVELDKELKKIEESESTVEDLKVEIERDLRYTLLYSDRQDFQNEVNKTKILNLAKLLVENQDYTTHLLVHTDHREPGLPEFMQYNTLKRANLVGEILMNYGVEPGRIVIESMCDNYPIARKEVAGNKNDEHLPLNKRIDLEIRDGSGALLMNQRIKDFKLPGYASDRKYELFTHIREEVYYSIEIARSDIIFKNAVLRLYSDIYIRREDGKGDNLYYIGMYPNYEDARLLQEELKESSAPYARITAFHQGQPITDDQIKALSEDYPDLSNYAAAKEKQNN